MRYFLTLILFSSSIYARVVAPEIDDALNYKISSEYVPKTNSKSKSKSKLDPKAKPTNNDRNLASENEGGEEYQSEYQEDEFQTEDNYLEDQERDLASEQDPDFESPKIRYWKY